MVIYQSEENYKGSYFKIAREGGDYMLKLFGTWDGKNNQLISVIPIPNPEQMGRTLISSVIGHDEWVTYVP